MGLVYFVLGYGNVTPRTSWGRLITIAYALVGIPLMLVYLSTVGDTLAQYFRSIYGKLTRTKKKKHEKHKGEHSFISAKGTIHNHLPEKKYQEITCDVQERQRVPILLTLFVVLAYIAAGACLFNRLENWTLIEGSYFCFTSLGTIGFGELIPGSKESSNDVSVFISCAFILIGMAVIAMCFNLLQDETIVMVRKMNSWWNRPDKVEDEDIVSNLKSSWHREPPTGCEQNVKKFPSDLKHYSLPRRKEPFKYANNFDRSAPARNSTGGSRTQDPLVEYFVPRSMSEFNLSVLVDPIPPLPPSAMRSSRNRDKMVTFEDDQNAQCAKKSVALEDVFM